MSLFPRILRCAVVTAFVLCALGRTENAFATCGDYLQHSDNFSHDAGDSEVLMPVEYPGHFPSKCANGRCGNDPEKTPLGTTQSDLRVRIRTSSTLEDLLHLIGSKDRSNYLLPSSDSAPEQVTLDPLDPPPRSF